MDPTGIDNHPDEATPETPQETQPPISRLNSISERVKGVTERTHKLMASAKTVTPANKMTLDGVLIDRRLTEPSGILYKAKMIGSLSVQFHKGDKMAVDAMRDLKVMSKTSGRHKPRIFLRISIQGIHILEEGTMKQIDIHDLDKISYLAEDPEDKKVFAYIYNKQIKKKESGAVSTVHRLFAIKSPKSVNVVSNMKAVFHYMYDMRMSDDKPDIPIGHMETVKKQVSAVRPSAPKEIEEKKEEPLSFNYGTLVDIVDSEDLIRPAVPANPEIFLAENQASSSLDPGPAVNIYVTQPRGNRLEIAEEAEPVYSTVRKIKEEPRTAPPAPRNSNVDFGMVNPSWDRSAAPSTDEDPFSLDRYAGEGSSTSSDETDEEHVFGVGPPSAIPSAVFLESQEYEWDIGEERPRNYSEGQTALSEHRERLSTVTKQAVASLERVREEQKTGSPKDSLIDFATFQDRLEDEDPLDLFDTLKSKPATSSARSDDLLGLDFAFNTPSDPKKQSVVMPSAETQKYNIDISSLLTDPNTYSNNPPAANLPQQMGMFGAAPGQSTQGNMFGTMPAQPQGNIVFPAGPAQGSGSGRSTPNYQPGPNYQPYAFPVSFGAADSTQKTSTTTGKPNPFHKPAKSNSFDPFGDLMNDAI